MFAWRFLLIQVVIDESRILFRRSQWRKYSRNSGKRDTNDQGGRDLYRATRRVCCRKYRVFHGTECSDTPHSGVSAVESTECFMEQNARIHLTQACRPCRFSCPLPKP
ncbi:hypothetical protein RRG08_048583 [Elysia crispata]|uniref:Uncharacterized protein n=1 Tax=Elysia crispata TaxID=231223 RepID=A0AAE1EAU0_9GAST|nr:hypothetical protein RRG08_048583 [Elysia crispata]